MRGGARSFWVTLVFWLASCGGAPPPTPAPPAPANVRAGIQPVYFGVTDDTVAATTTQTQAVWSNGWGPDGYQAQVRGQLQQAQALGATYGVLAVDTVMQADGGAAARLGAILGDLQRAGVLSLVKVLFVCDECEQKGYTAAEMAAAAALVRGVAATYPELADMQLMANYGCGNEFPGWQAMDIVSCDRYDRSAAETHGDLRTKAPGKKYGLVDGAVEPFLQDPWPFLDEAQADPDVVVIVFFIAHDNADTGLGRGILNNALAGAVCGVSRSLLTHRRTPC